MLQVMLSFETPIPALRHIPEDGHLHPFLFHPYICPAIHISQKVTGVYKKVKIT
jgi:hypothetical protein